MEVNIIADSKRGAYEYHVRTHLGATFNNHAKILIVKVDAINSISFEDVRFLDMSPSQVILKGVDTETKIQRKILVTL